MPNSTTILQTAISSATAAAPVYMHIRTLICCHIMHVRTCIIDRCIQRFYFVEILFFSPEHFACIHFLLRPHACTIHVTSQLRTRPMCTICTQITSDGGSNSCNTHGFKYANHTFICLACMDAYAHSYHSMSACIHVTISVSGVSKGYIEGYQRVCLLPPVRRDCHSRSASRPEKSSTSTLYHQTLSWQPAFQRTESTKKRHEQQQTGNV